MTTIESVPRMVDEIECVLSVALAVAIFPFAARRPLALAAALGLVGGCTPYGALTLQPRERRRSKGRRSLIVRLLHLR